MSFKNDTYDCLYSYIKMEITGEDPTNSCVLVLFDEIQGIPLFPEGYFGGISRIYFFFYEVKMQHLIFRDVSGFGPF